MDYPTKKHPFPIKLIVLFILLFILGIAVTHVLTDYDLHRNNRKQSTESNKSSGNGNSESNKLDIKINSEKEMHQLGKHFNKHGREMGHASKKEYQKAAVEFAKKYKTHSNSKIMQGTWNGKGAYTDVKQIAISFEERTVILDKQTGQLIDFYKGTELRGLKELIQILP